MRILLTGGAGYIASHTAVELLEKGHTVDAVDNLANGHRQAVDRVREISGREYRLFELDLTDEAEIDSVLEQGRYDACVHFAGHKSVAESVADPLEYYSNNIVSTLNLLKSMERHDVKELVFSSSATVYGKPTKLPLDEECQTGVELTNPYGWSKSMVEQILRDAGAADPQLKVTILRYFNPVGAHPSGLIGEDPGQSPNNLLPFVSQVASGVRPFLSIYGGEYATTDGTGVRDYVHVMDIARGHVAAVTRAGAGVETLNLGTGRGTSVLELVRLFSSVNGVDVPYRVVDAREGDVAECFADVTKARRVLGWNAELSVEEACRDAWNWQVRNPRGYAS